MSWPEDVDLVFLTWGRALNVLGEGATGMLRVNLVTPGTPYIIWANTGQPLLGISASKLTGAEQTGDLALPAVDQDGWLDSGGHPYKGWAYEIHVRYEYQNQSIEIERTIQLVKGQTNVDFDLIFDDAIAEPWVGQTAFLIDYNAIGVVVRTYDSNVEAWPDIALPPGFTGIVWWVSTHDQTAPPPPEARDIDAWFASVASV